jgi:methylation protein MtfA
VTTTLDVPGRAGEFVRELGGRARLHDLYDDTGSGVYDDLCAADTSELREILHLVRRTKGPVLELAAGSGRLTFPLLATGREVTALELSPGMLSLLTDRLAEAPARLRERCLPVRGDMSRFALGRRFGAIVLGTTSVSLLDESGRAGLYRAVGEHLLPGGSFLVSVIDPAPAEVSDPETEFAVTGATGRRYRMVEYWPPAAPTRTVTVLPADPPAEGPVDVCVSTVRIVSADRLAAELTAAGLVVRARHALPGGGPRHREVLLEVGTA